MAVAPGKRTAAFSDAQLQHFQKFKEAVLYAKSVLVDPDVKAQYQSKAKPGESAFNVAVADFLVPPVMNEIDCGLYTGQVGSLIKVKATDNFKINSIMVAIYKADDSLLESGAAVVSGNGIDWVYTATHLNATLTGCKVVATATDTPGHKVEMTQMM